MLTINTSRQRMLALLGAGAIVMIMATACTAPPLQNVSNVTVKKTERIEINDREQYMVYTNKGVFKNTDDSRYGKSNSADLYAEIEEGMFCQFQISGERNSKRSEYPNIITASCVMGAG